MLRRRWWRSWRRTAGPTCRSICAAPPLAGAVGVAAQRKPAASSGSVELPEVCSSATTATFLATDPRQGLLSGGWGEGCVRALASRQASIREGVGSSNRADSGGVVDA